MQKFTKMRVQRTSQAGTKFKTHNLNAETLRRILGRKEGDSEVQGAVRRLEAGQTVLIRTKNTLGAKTEYRITPE